MPSINTSHFVSHGKWEVNHRRCPATGSTLFDLSLVVDHIDALHVVGLSVADVDELIHELKSAAQDADMCRLADHIDRLLAPQDCAGVNLAEAAKPLPLDPKKYGIGQGNSAWDAVAGPALNAVNRALTDEEPPF